jgi:hypothetical protein
MKSLLPLALGASLALAGYALAQPEQSPGEAKGNPPIKQQHTVDDGAAKPGANSFTEKQAKQHILNSGYTSVSDLTKGSDGIWRGVATKGGQQIRVALDFKGNVSEEGASSQ